MMRATGEISVRNEHYPEQTREGDAFPRVQPRVEARLKVHYGPLRNLLTGYSVNLSSGGLFLETEQPLAEETPLAIEFFLPESGRIIRCRGRVAWINRPDNPVKPHFPAGMGLQFLDLSFEDMGEIRDFVKRQLISATW